MRYMLLQSYGAAGSDCPPMTQWSPADIKAHIEFQQALNADVTQARAAQDGMSFSG